MEHLEGAWRLERISPRAYQHPADSSSRIRTSSELPVQHPDPRELVLTEPSDAARSARS
jgi:hypothetical protein